jgi:putative membrane protein
MGGSLDKWSIRLAEDRTVLAAERTYAAWLRTGLAFLLAGLAVQRLLREAFPHWQLKLLAFVLSLCAFAAFLAAAWRHERTWDRLPAPDVQLLPARIAIAVALALAFVSALATIAVWFA